jgi:Cdc6-like AAA superfamily ATPase
MSIFSGCATTELQTQTKMTQTIFVDPVKKSDRTIYVSVKNTSGQNIGDFEQKLDNKLAAKNIIPHFVKTTLYKS